MNDLDRLGLFSEILDQFHSRQEQIQRALRTDDELYRAAIASTIQPFKVAVEENGLFKAAQEIEQLRESIYGEIEDLAAALHGPAVRWYGGDFSAAGIEAREHLQEISMAIDRGVNLYQGRDLEASRLILERALNPFPSVQLAGLVNDWSAPFREALQRISDGIVGAAYIGELEIEGEDEVGGVEDEDDYSSDFESRLIEVVPAETLVQLGKVGFAPIGELDRILRSPEAMRALSARDFEYFVAELIDRLGFENVHVTPRSGDQGRDIVATKVVNGIPILFAFECKQYRPDRRVGVDILRGLLGTITHGSTRATKGVLVTTSTFTSGARKYLLTEPTLDGKDFEGVVGWLREYAELSRRR